MKSIAAFATTVLFAVAGVEAKPLKVFILAGQSNMEGPASISTFDYIGDDPATAPMLTGCAKTFALIGKNFAEANLAMMRQQQQP